MGNVAPVLLGISTRLYYQDSAGAIRQNDLTPGPFTTAHTVAAAVLIVPAGQALVGTPVAVTAPPVGDSADEVGRSSSLLVPRCSLLVARGIVADTSRPRNMLCFCSFGSL